MASEHITETSDLPEVVAVGAGRMGRGIAHVMAYAGFHITLVDMKARGLDERRALMQTAEREIRTNLATVAHAGIVQQTDIATILSRIT